MSSRTGTGRAAEIRDLLRRRMFRRLLASQIASQTADGLYQIALAAVLIFDVSVSRTPGQVTKVLAVTLLPFSLVGPFTGPFIDRFSRRSILVATSVTRAVLTLLLVPALSWPEPALLGLVVANMSVNRFFHTTRSAVLPTLVPRERYLLANTVASVAGMVFGLLGAVAGGPVADLISEEVVVVAATVLMVLAAAFATTLRLTPGERAGLTGLVTELRDNARDVVRGIRTMRESARATYAVSAIWTMRGLVGFLLLAGVVLLRTRFDLRATGASILLASIALGGFVGALVLPWAAARLRNAGVAPAAFALAGVAMLALGPIPVWPALVAAVFFGGLAMMATKVASDTMVQRAIGDAFRGRAFAVYDIGYNGVFVLAALIPALLVSTVGEVGIVILAGAAGLAGAVAMGAWARRLPEAIDVRTYAGARGDEVPREVVWDGEVLRVVEVERAWHEDRAGERLLVFRLRLSDGRRVQVSRGPEWRLDRMLTRS